MFLMNKISEVYYSLNKKIVNTAHIIPYLFDQFKTVIIYKQYSNHEDLFKNNSANKCRTFFILQ